MQFLAGFFLSVGSFFSSLFGGTPAPLEPVAVPVVEEVVATTTPLEQATTTPKAITPAPKPVVVKAVIPATTTVALVATSSPIATSTTSAKGSSGSAAFTLSASVPSKMEEKETITLHATYGGTDVTKETTFEVLGPIGSVKGGVFTAKLSADLAEFGHAPGAIVAKYKGMEAQTAIFEVEAFVPEAIDIGGQ